MSNYQNGLPGYNTSDSWAWPTHHISLRLWVKFILRITTKKKPFFPSCLLCLNTVYTNLNFSFCFESCFTSYSAPLVSPRLFSLPESQTPKTFHMFVTAKGHILKPRSFPVTQTLLHSDVLTGPISSFQKVRLPCHLSILKGQGQKSTYFHFNCIMH